MEEYIGSIELFPYGWTPDGWALCNGATLTISANQALYALIGTIYGGNGTSNFMIPNLLGFEPVPNMQYYIALQGYFPPRQ